MGLTAAHGGFGAMEWALFGLMSAESVALTHWDQKLYLLAPWTATAVNLVMLATWRYGSVQAFAWVLSGFLRFSTWAAPTFYNRGAESR